MLPDRSQHIQRPRPAQRRKDQQAGLATLARRRRARCGREMSRVPSPWFLRAESAVPATRPDSPSVITGLRLRARRGSF